MRFLGHLISTGLALWLTALVLPGMHLGDDAAPVLDQVLVIGAVALVVALVNMLVRPVLSALAMPITCLTLGLFQLVVNTLMLLLAAWICQRLGLTLVFDGFWWALLAGIIIGLLSSLIEGIAGTGRDSRRGERSRRDD